MIQFFDINGRLVHSKNLELLATGWQQVFFDLDDLGDGIYTIQLSTIEAAEVKKIVIQE